MNRYFTFFFTLLFGFTTLKAQERGMRPTIIKIEDSSITLYKQSHALLIGATTYTNGLKSLPGVKEDINAVEDVLKKRGFSIVRVIDPDNIELVNAFNEFIGQFGQEKNSCLVFYFAGHGYTKNISGNEIGYLLPVNCPNPERDPIGFQTKAMPMGQIELFAQQIQAKHALFLFDACFSGSVFSQTRDIPGIITYKTTQPVRQFITSGSAEETVPDKSIFRIQLIAGLNGDADLNKDNFITGSELGEFLQTSVVNYSRNSLHPQYGKIRDPNLDKGDFVFVSSKDALMITESEKKSKIILSDIKNQGILELTTEVSGNLFIDNVFSQKVIKDSLIKLTDLPFGEHILIISGEERIVKKINVVPNETLFLQITKTKNESYPDTPKTPTIMILPSDNWCEQRYFMIEIDDQGTKRKVPNYKQVFQEDTEIGPVISKIGSIFLKYGFHLKDAEQEMKSIFDRTAEDNVTTNTNGGQSLSETPLDMLKQKAKADLIIQIWWKVNKTINGKSISFTLDAIDSYTNKRISSCTGNSPLNNIDSLPVLIQDAINTNIDSLASQLQLYFNDILSNGREIILTIRKWNNWNKNFDSEIDGKEITDYINEWIQKNTVKGQFNMSTATETIIRYEQVRIPLYDLNSNAIDACQFAKGLQKHLKSAPLNFEVKLMSRGLGEAILLIGKN